MEKRWSKTELTHLKRNADKQTHDELAQRFNTDTETVLAKLEELGLVSEGGTKVEADKGLELYEQALTQVNDRDWKKAADLFKQVVETSDGRQLKDRARQYLATCERYLSDPVKADDPYFEAVVAKNQGKIVEALNICADKGDMADERYLYLNASLKALNGDAEDAIEMLRSAIASEPKNRIHAYHDPDFENLEKLEEFQELVAQD
jgi:tetratricopeptide (TPR) repeat protein